MTTAIESFAKLGRAFKNRAIPSNFAEVVTDEETLSLIRSVYEKRLRGRITNLFNVTLDDAGTFNGEIQQRVSPRLTKRFSFEWGDDSIQFKPINPNDIEKFSEKEDVEDFAPHSKRDAKKFKCKIAPCGGRCLKSGETCRQTMSAEERKAHDKAVRNRGKVETSLAKSQREIKVAKEAEMAKVSIKKERLSASNKSASSSKSAPKKSLEQIVSDLKAYEKTDEYRKSGAGGTIDRLVYLANSKDKEAIVRNFNDAWAKAGVRIKDSDSDVVTDATRQIFKQIIPKLSAADKEAIVKDNKFLYKDIASPPKSQDKDFQNFHNEMKKIYKKIAESDPYF